MTSPAETLLAAFRKAFPAEAMSVLAPPDADFPVVDLYPVHIFTAPVVAEIVACLDRALGGEAAFQNWYCAEADLPEAAEAALSALHDLHDVLGVDASWVHRYAPGSIEYVAFGSCPGYFHIELGGSNVMSGVDVYGWVTPATEPPCRPA